MKLLVSLNGLRVIFISPYIQLALFIVQIISWGVEGRIDDPLLFYLHLANLIIAGQAYRSKSGDSLFYIVIGIAIA
jgi:hypothetical protein